MIKFGTLMMSCALLLAFAATGAEAQTMRKQKGKMVGQTEQVRPRRPSPPRCLKQRAIATRSLRPDFTTRNRTNRLRNVPIRSIRRRQRGHS